MMKRSLLVAVATIAACSRPSADDRAQVMAIAEQYLAFHPSLILDDSHAGTRVFVLEDDRLYDVGAKAEMPKESAASFCRGHDCAVFAYSCKVHPCLICHRRVPPVGRGFEDCSRTTFKRLLDGGWHTAREDHVSGREHLDGSGLFLPAPDQ